MLVGFLDRIRRKLRRPPQLDRAPTAGATQADFRMVGISSGSSIGHAALPKRCSPNTCRRKSPCLMQLPSSTGIIEIPRGYMKKISVIAVIRHRLYAKTLPLTIWIDFDFQPGVPTVGRSDCASRRTAHRRIAPVVRRATPPLLRRPAASCSLLGP